MGKYHPLIRNSSKPVQLPNEARVAMVPVPGLCSGRTCHPRWAARKTKEGAMKARKLLWGFVCLLLLSCGGGGGGPQSINAAVQVSWVANREAAVNAAGGGYKVYYSKTSGFNVASASFVDVPYVSGPTAPTTTTLTLSSGTNFVKVVAYSTLNPGGSAPSAQVSVSVPFASALVARHD